MLFQQLVNKIFRNRLVASLLTSCDNAVPTTCQQDFSQQACSKLLQIFVSRLCSQEENPFFLRWLQEWTIRIID
jgi:hypothetical protein